MVAFPLLGLSELSESAMLSAVANEAKWRAHVANVHKNVFAVRVFKMRA